MTNKRLLFIDYAKGIAILLMLLQHSIPQHNLCRQILQSFIMPLFFVTGGFLWQIKVVSGKEVGLSIDYLKKRVRRLGIPYLLAGIVLLIFYEFLSIMAGGHSFVHNLSRLISLQGIDSLWFLPVYFVAECLFLLSLRFKDYRIHVLLVLTVLLILRLIVPYEGTAWPFALFEKSLMGFLFFTAGFYCSHFRFDILHPVVMIILCCMGVIGSFYNGFSSFAELHSPVLFFFDGVVLSIVLMAICRWLEFSKLPEVRFLSFFGKETLFILCTNNLVIETVRLLDHKISGDVLLHYGMLGNLLMFVIIMLLEILLIVAFRSLRCFINAK